MIIAIPNLLFLVLLAAATTTGLLQRGLQPPADGTVDRWWQRPAWWGVAFLVLAVLGSWMSPLPAAAWSLTAGWALHVAAPWALWPCIRRRPHLVVAGLMAGLAGELVLMTGQAWFERPALAAQLAGDPALTVEARVADQYRVRIGSWRLEGTFLLANTLASYLLSVMPLVICMAWRSRTAGWPVRALAAAGAGVVVLALVMTGSKAGILAMALAAATAAVVTLRSWRWRGALIAGVAALVLAAWMLPGLRTAVVGSAGVRLDYWRAGAALVAERPLLGHGLEGFAVHYPRVKPPAGEETILAHQETLQAAVDLGLPAMLVLIGWWLSLLWSLRPVGGLPVRARDDQRVDAATLIGAAVLLLFAVPVAGILQANLATYPGAMPLAWALALVAGLLAVARQAARLPLPGPWACWCAVLAVLWHVQADFSLHSMQVVGVLAWVACLGQALARPLPAPVSTIAATGRQGVFAVAGLLVLAAVTTGIIGSSQRGEVLERAQHVEGILARLRLAEAGRLDEAQRGAAFDAFEHAFSRLVVEDGRSALTADPREALGMAMITRAVAASSRFPADHDLVFAAVAIAEHLQTLLPARAGVLTPVLEGLLAEWPEDLLVTKALSEHYLRLARAAAEGSRHVLARQAQALAGRAVALYPTHLPLRQTLIAAAELNGDAATVAEQRAEIARLQPLVHPDNRTR